MSETFPGSVSKQEINDAHEAAIEEDRQRYLDLAHTLDEGELLPPKQEGEFSSEPLKVEEVQQFIRQVGEHAHSKVDQGYTEQRTLVESAKDPSDKAMILGFLNEEMSDPADKELRDQYMRVTTEMKVAGAVYGAANEIARLMDMRLDTRAHKPGSGQMLSTTEYGRYANAGRDVSLVDVFESERQGQGFYMKSGTTENPSFAIGEGLAMMIYNEPAEVRARLAREETEGMAAA